MKKLTYKDPALLLSIKADAYGDYTIIQDRVSIKTLFFYGMSSDPSGNVDNIIADAHAYLDIEDDFVHRNMERVEGMYLVFNRYGENVWYRISRAKVGRTGLTDNVDNCLEVFLNKSSAVVDLNGESS